MYIYNFNGFVLCANKIHIYPSILCDLLIHVYRIQALRRLSTTSSGVYHCELKAVRQIVSYAFVLLYKEVFQLFYQCNCSGLAYDNCSLHFLLFQTLFKSRKSWKVTRLASKISSWKQKVVQVLGASFFLQYQQIIKSITLAMLHVLRLVYDEHWY